MTFIKIQRLSNTFNNYEKNIIEKMTMLKCNNTNLRINKKINKVENLLLIDKSKSNYFDYLQSFDGTLDKKYKDNIFLYKYNNVNNKNKYDIFKKQYSFIEEQYKCLKKDNKHIFINIFSNTFSSEDYKHFNHLSKSPEYKDIYYRCFIGDLDTLNNWFSKFINKDN